MQKNPTNILDVFVLESPQNIDERGSSTVLDLKDVQEVLPLNYQRWYTSTSHLGVIRGFHLASKIRNQHKIISCVSGRIIDVLIDLRVESESYLQKYTVELTGDDGKYLLVPPGIGHGYQALEEKSVVSYLITDTYEPLEEITLNPLSKSLGISWPISPSWISDRDLNGMSINAYQELP